MTVRAPQYITGTAGAFFGRLQCPVVKIRRVPFRALDSLFINNASELLAQLLQNLVILWNTLANRLPVTRNSLDKPSCSRLPHHLATRTSCSGVDAEYLQ
jgi:hypothetical protein